MADSTSSDEEAIIQRTINGIQRMISLHNNEGDTNGATTEAVIEISLAAKKHWELEIKVLQEVLRGVDKLREISKNKQEEYGNAEDSENTERLIPEIEMLRFVLFLVSRKI